MLCEASDDKGGMQMQQLARDDAMLELMEESFQEVN